MSNNVIPFELESLSNATEYQKWFFELVSPYLGKRILEVGSGIGNMSTWLNVGDLLTLSEADEALIPVLKNKILNHFKDKEKIEIYKVDLENSKWVDELKLKNFDTIISFNVMEHIVDHFSSFSNFYEILKASNVDGTKKIITIVPAHQWAYGTFDSKFKHIRRYSYKDFYQIRENCFPTADIKFQYINLIGLAGWVLMGKILKKENLGNSSVDLFEKICPHIKKFDNFLHQNLRIPVGQSILCVYSF